MKKIILILALIAVTAIVQAVPNMTPSGTLTAGFCKHGYSVQFTATGLTGTPTFSITAGSLPPGVTLSTSGLLSGVISTTSAATYTFNVRAIGTGTVSVTKNDFISVTAISDLTLEQMWKYWTSPTYPTNYQVFDTWSSLRTTGITGCNGGVTTRECTQIYDRANRYDNYNKHFLINTSSDIQDGSIPYSAIVLDSLTAIYQVSGHRPGISSLFVQDTQNTYLSSPGTFSLTSTSLSHFGSANAKSYLDMDSTGYNYMFGNSNELQTRDANSTVDFIEDSPSAWHISTQNFNDSHVSQILGDKDRLLIQAHDSVLLSGAVTSVSIKQGVVVGTGDVSINTAGYGLKVKGGSNAKQGQASLAGTSVAVSNTSVTANSRILLTEVGAGSLGNVYVSAVTPASGFTITAAVTHTTTVNYFIFENQ